MKKNKKIKLQKQAYTKKLRFFFVILLVLVFLNNLLCNKVARGQEEPCADIISVTIQQEKINSGEKFTCIVKAMVPDGADELLTGANLRCGMITDSNETSRATLCQSSDEINLNTDEQNSTLEVPFICELDKIEGIADGQEIKLVGFDSGSNCGESIDKRTSFVIGQDNSSEEKTDRENVLEYTISELLTKIFGSEQSDNTNREMEDSGNSSKETVPTGEYGKKGKLMVQLYNEIVDKCAVKGVPGKVTNFDFACLDNINLPIDKDLLQGTIDTLKDQATSYNSPFSPGGSPRLECVTFAKAGCFLLSGGDRECGGAYGNADNWINSHPSRYTAHRIGSTKAEPGDLVVWSNMHIAVATKSIDEETFEIVEGNFDSDGKVNIRSVRYSDPNLSGILKE